MAYGVLKERRELHVPFVFNRQRLYCTQFKPKTQSPLHVSLHTKLPSKLLAFIQSTFCFLSTLSAYLTYTRDPCELLCWL